MSQNLPWQILVIYCIYTIFSLQQKRCYLSFQGASQGYGFLLGILAIFNLLFGFGFLVFYAFMTTWWTPLFLFTLGLFIYTPLSPLRLMHSRFALLVWGFSSFIVIPICAMLLIHFTPRFGAASPSSARNPVESRSDLHYTNSKRACDQALTVVIKFGGATALPAKEAADVVQLLKASITEAELVKDSYLQQVHPAFVKRYKEDYIASLQSLAEAIRTGDKVKQMTASAKYNNFSEWMSAHAKELRFP